MSEREELLKLCDKFMRQYLPINPEHQMARALRELLSPARGDGGRGRLPAFNELPDDIREALETAIYLTVSDEDHWCVEAAENVYEAVREHVCPKLTGPTQEWVSKFTSRDEYEPPVLGAGLPLPTPPSAEGEPVGWIQELGDGRVFFQLGNLDPREVHDNGRPCYPVYRAAAPVSTERMVEALRFYADKKNYKPRDFVDIGVGEQAVPGTEEILEDGGSRAREALSQAPQEDSNAG